MSDTTNTSAAVAAYLKDKQTQDTATQARMGFMLGSQANPDYEAELRRVAAATGVPVESARANPEAVKQQAQMRTLDFGQLAQKFPRTAGFLTGVEDAKLAHDDAENMGLVETMLNSFKRGWPALKALPDNLQVVNQAGWIKTFGDIDKRLAAGEDPKTVLNDYGSMGMAPLPWFDSKQALASYQATKAKVLPHAQQTLSESAASAAALNVERSKIPAPPVVEKVMKAKTFGEAWAAIKTDPVRFIAAIGPESLVQSAPGLLAAVPAGIALGPAGAVGAIGTGSMVTDYSASVMEVLQSSGVNTTDPEAIKAALKNPEILTKVVEQSGKHAAVVGAFDALSAGLASKTLLPKAVADRIASPVVRELAGIGVQVPVQAAMGAAGEAGGELAAGQELQPGQIVAEAAGEMFGTPAEVVSVAGTQIRERVQKAQQAEAAAAQLEQLGKAAQASKLLARDADTFERFVAQAAEGSEVQDVYIDAKDLMQSGMAEQVAAVSPSVAGQLQEALATGGTLRIPVAEYTARIAGTELNQSLIDHLKVEPEGMSRAQAKEFMQTQGEELRAEVERVMAEKQGNAEFKASAEVVKGQVLEQLNRVARFSPEVNGAYATMMGNFYAVAAAKLGITPEEMAQRFPITVAAEGVTGGPVLQQGGIAAPLPSESRDTAPVGAWVKLPYPDMRGQPVAQVREIPVADLFLPELNEKGQLQPEKRGYVAGYVEKLKAGQQPPVIDVVEMEDGRLRVVDGHRRVVAAKEAGAATVRALVSPLIDVPGEGKVPLTVELAQQLNQSQPLPSTINVDGAERPTVNSNGQPIAATEEGVRNFWRWFGDSKVVDAEGRPLVVYHGSPAVDKIKGNGFKKGWTHLTDSKPVADSYQEQPGSGEKGTLELFVKVENPAYYDAGGAKYTDIGNKVFRATWDAERAGHDALIIKNIRDNFDSSVPTTPHTTVVAFTSTQIKSAIGNSGAFDPANPNILHQSGYHGTPHRGIEKFSTDKIGTGEGAQAYGWGLYFASKRDVAEHYRNKLSNPAEADGLYVEQNGDGAWVVYNKDDEVVDAFDTQDEAEASIASKGDGQLYRVEIPEDNEMLLWDKPLSEQPDAAKLREIAVEEDLPINYQKKGLHGNRTGEDFYKAMSQVLGSDKAASQVLESYGIKGIKHLDTNGHAPGGISHSFVIFNGDNAQIVEQYYQRQQAQGNRGMFNPATSTITLLKAADLSTFLHESGHFFLEVQLKLAEQLMAQAAEGNVLSEGERSIVGDAEALLKWFGVESLAEWRSLDFEEMRSYHEKFARGFEAYLFEGRAPSIELQGVFQRFRAWLLNIYRDIKNLNVQLTDEVRQVFDRMMATNEEIMLAEKGRSMLALFSTPEQMGVSPEEFARYQALGVDATNEAIQDLQARTLRDLAWARNARGREIKRLQREAKDKRAEVEMDARREVMSQPVYQVWQALRSRGDDRVRLRTDAVAEMATPDEAKLLKERRFTSPEGMHPDVVAEMFEGFSSGSELIQKLAQADDPKVAIEALADLRMLERHGELATPEAIERAADVAIHNEARGRMIATEANALAKAAGKRTVMASAAREFARAAIARLKVRDIRPGQYAAAEVRAAKAAASASAKGDTAQAAAEKRNQLLSTYLTRAAYDAQDEVKKAVEYLKKFDTEAPRKGLDADYLGQIDTLLERFDLRTGQSLKDIDKRTTLAEWVESQREMGLEPDVPAELLNEAARKSYKDMTVEELRGLTDAVKQIEHLGRLKKRLLTAKDQREYEAIRDEMAASITANAGDRQADTRTPITNAGRAVQGLKRFWAAHTKAATYARVMDGGKDGGPVWEYIIRPANERGDMETRMRAEATLRLSEILAPVFKLGKMGGKGQFFPSINRSLNREARIAIALNMGNEGNAQRLLGGEGWTMEQVMPVLQSLTSAEWQAVQAIWDHFESYRPEIAAKERRVYGKEPTWVEPRALDVRTADGQELTLRGGYYPIKYDPQASQRAEEHADAEGAKRQLQGAYTSATTRRSFTKSRVEEVSGRPLLYTLSGLYSGVNDVIHDLAWHEWLIDANRLMRSKTIDAAIRNHYGPEAKAQFKSWIADIAEGDQGAANAAEAALSRLRQGVSVAGLGFNVMSALMQPLGITQSIVRVGATWVGRGVAQYLANPVRAAREVNAKSEFMASRARTRFRELNELRNQVQDESTAKRVIGQGAYFLMMRFQQMVDTPTWLGAYEKAVAEGNDEARAISLADQAVIDAQGGGQTKDLAAIERGGPALKLFTVFYSFMNTALNLGVQQTMTANTPAKKAKLAADMLLLYVVPPVLGYILKQAATPGDDDLDDPEKLAKSLAANQLDYLMGLMVVVREFAEAAKLVTGANDKGRDYQGPAGLRVIADTGNMAKQVHQGEFDDSFRKAAINLLGGVLGLPAAQINRTITGVQALNEGKTTNPAAVAFGYQEQR